MELVDCQLVAGLRNIYGSAHIMDFSCQGRRLNKETRTIG